MRGRADVAVVEPDGAEAGAHELGAQVVVPEVHLHAQAHDQQERLAATVRTDVLVGQLDVAVAGARGGLRHAVSRSPTSDSVIDVASRSTSPIASRSALSP